MSALNRTEFKSALALASVVGLRMFGLFLVLPVLAFYLQTMPGATPALIGLALGVYGIGHMLLQIPMGMLSDRVGRKPVITFGLALFALGSLTAALAHGVTGIILGRALQGTGAVTGSSQALAADLSREQSRGAVMGIIGAMIGAAFLLALLLGPPLAAVAGLQGLFALTFVLVLGAIALLWGVVPHAPPPRGHASAGIGSILGTLRDRRLLLLDASVFALHGVLTAFFIAMPLLLARDLGLPPAAQWRIYVPALLAAAVAMGLLLPRLRTLGASVRLVQASVVAVGLGLAGLALTGGSVWMAGAAAMVFFVGFNLLEASLPSLVSRIAPAPMRGAALGAYSASQFCGMAAGGILGGLLLGRYGVSGLFAAAAALSLPWSLLLARGARPMIAAQAVPP
ncbi:MAG: MFS transporter [Xanthomonadaceae bacterium]|nr:MFS transporter [Xanthomonadaceae bacterium]MDE2245715.1 MFS transporter [Xanthomonadaceae bacterium]